MGAAVSLSQNFSAAPLSSGTKSATLHTLPLLQCGMLPTENSSPQTSFPQAAVLNKLLSMSLFNEAQSFRTVPCGVTSPARKPVPAWAPLSMHSQVLPAAYSGTGFPQGHGFLWAATFHSCRGISAPLPVAPPPLLLQHPGCLQDCFSQIFPLLSSPAAIYLCAVTFTPPSLCYPRGPTSVTDGLSPDQQWVNLGAIWLHWTQGKFQQLLTKATLAATPSTKTLPCKPSATTHEIGWAAQTDRQLVA